MALVRYIHLNPVRANLVNTMGDLDRYPWSGHRMIIGKDEYPWMDRAYFLGQFASTKRRAIQAYHLFVEERLGEGRRPELAGGSLIRSQGGWSQVLALRSRGEKESSDERILGRGELLDYILLTIQFLFPKQTGGKGDAGEIILINGDVPRIIVKAPEAVHIETERWQGGGRK